MDEDIRNQDTIEVISPVRRKKRRRRRVLVAFVVSVAVLGAATLAATIVVATSPQLRERIARNRPGTRRLAITSAPTGALVYVAETAVGTTPLHVPIALGTYEVRAVLDGHDSWRQAIDTRETATLHIALRRLQVGCLIVESVPDKARVYLDKVHCGLTPLTIEQIEAGTYAVLIKKLGYLDEAREVAIAADQTTRLAARLKSSSVPIYLEAIEDEPTRLSNYTDLLRVYVLRRDAASAAQLVPKALAVVANAKPDSTGLERFFNGMADVLGGKAGAVDDAARSRIVDAMVGLLEKMIAEHASQPSLYRSLVGQLGRAGQFSRIVATCDKLAANPKVGHLPHTYIAGMFLDWEEYSCAIVLLQKAVEAKPTYLSARRYLADAYAKASRFDDALVQYAEAEKLAANSKAYYQALIHVGIARVLIARSKTEGSDAAGDVQKAIARYHKALALGVSENYAYQWRLRFAELLADNGRRKDAIAQYLAVEGSSPNYRVRRLAKAARLRLTKKTP